MFLSDLKDKNLKGKKISCIVKQVYRNVNFFIKCRYSYVKSKTGWILGMIFKTLVHDKMHMYILIVKNKKGNILLRSNMASISVSQSGFTDFKCSPQNLHWWFYPCDFCLRIACWIRFMLYKKVFQPAVVLSFVLLKNILIFAYADY